MWGSLGPGEWSTHRAKATVINIWSGHKIGQRASERKGRRTMGGGRRAEACHWRNSQASNRQGWGGGGKGGGTWDVLFWNKNPLHAQFKQDLWLAILRKERFSPSILVVWMWLPLRRGESESTEATSRRLCVREIKLPSGHYHGAQGLRKLLRLWKLLSLYFLEPPSLQVRILEERFPSTPCFNAIFCTTLGPQPCLLSLCPLSSKLIEELPSSSEGCMCRPSQARKPDRVEGFRPSRIHTLW